MKYFFVFLVVFFQIQSFAGNSVQNGGDIVASQFVSIARLSVSELSLVNTSRQDMSEWIKSINENINQVTVRSSEHLYLDGLEVDAINRPNEKIILVSESRWVERRYTSFLSKIQFVLHEYLGVSGYDDSQYQISQKMTSVLDLAKISHLEEQDRFLLKLKELSAIYWWYKQNADGEPIKLSIFCMDVGETKSYLNEIFYTIENHKNWFSQPNLIDKDQQSLKAVFQSTQQMCIDQKINPKILAENSTKSYELVSDIEYLFRP